MSTPHENPMQEHGPPQRASEPQHQVTRSQAEALSQLTPQIEEARSGNLEVLGRLLEQCRGFLLVVAGKKFDPLLQSKLEPADLVQDALLEAVRAFATFRGTTGEHLLAWLTTILQFKLASAGRRYGGSKKRDQRLEQRLGDARDPAAHLAAFIDPESTPSRQAITAEQVQLVQEALAQLPEEYADAVRLRSQEYASFEEIGRRLGKSDSAVRGLWKRAVRTLRHLLRARTGEGSSGR